ncbi:hypothetical protein [Bacteroides sp. Marseille-P8574]|uniref:hypothetical protein n=1 Tax=Bacteroides sp. Marseille-P8574 TaxID=2697504 RepID=UPI00157CF932|nr:hypothetical protein [Bacteroides sp. Marseille-P8574]
MGKLIWIFIGLVAYLGGGWIAKDIVLSIIGDTILGDITFYECLTYSAIAAIFSLVATNIPDIGDNDNPKGLIWFFAIMIVTILIKEMPLSVGLIVLYNIVNIAAIILSVVTNKNIK